MSYLKGSGRSERESLCRLADIVAANPWLREHLSTDRPLGRGRTTTERVALDIWQALADKRSIELLEVIDILVWARAKWLRQPTLLVSPDEIVDLATPGASVGSILTHIESIVRSAREEIQVVAPYWEAPTLTSILKCAKIDEEGPSLLLMLVGHHGTSSNTPTILSWLKPIWPLERASVYVHPSAMWGSQDYPHAKCIVVDRTQGYVGSANFTQRGMASHFEVGTRLDSRDANALADILGRLRTSSELFRVLWEGEHTQPPRTSQDAVG